MTLKSKSVKVSNRTNCTVSSTQNMFSTCRGKNKDHTYTMKALYFRCGKPTNTDNIQQIRLVPKRHGTIFELQFIKKVLIRPSVEKPKRILSLDLGEVNLLAAVTNIPGLRPWIIDGGDVKYVNGCFNHDISQAQSRLEKSSGLKKSMLLNRLWYRREHKMRTLFHLYAKRVIDYCKLFNIEKIVAGYNTNWKCGSRLGKIGNRHFQKVPYRLFLKNLFDKAEMQGIEMCENEESYTSKCDALALTRLKRRYIAPFQVR